MPPSFVGALVAEATREGQPGRLGIVAAREDGDGAAELLAFSGAFGEIIYAKVPGRVEEGAGGREFVADDPEVPRLYETGEARPVMAAVVGAASRFIGLWADFGRVVGALAAVKGHPELVRETLDQLNCKSECDGWCPGAQLFKAQVLGVQNRDYQKRVADKSAGKEPSRKKFTTPVALLLCCEGQRRRDINANMKKSKRCSQARRGVKELSLVDLQLLELLSTKAREMVMKPIYIGPLHELTGANEPGPAEPEQRGDSDDDDAELVIAE